MPLLLCAFSLFLFKQKTAYEMRISDWSSDVCSSDLLRLPGHYRRPAEPPGLYDPRARGHEHRAPAGRTQGAAMMETVKCELLVIGGGPAGQSGRASCRERVGQYV